MPPTLPPLVLSLLHTLLDRAEKPDRQTVCRVTLNPRQHAVYFDHHETRAAVHQTLQALAAQGVLMLHWVKGQPHLLEKIDLAPDQAAALYALLDRTPRAAQQAALQTLLQAQTPHAPWHAAFLQWAGAQVAAHKSPTPLRLDAAAQNHALLTALSALAQLTAPTLERTLSVRLFGNSKRLEELRNAMVQVLRRFSPQAELLADDERALLAAHWLERVPEYVALAGPLQLRVNDQLCDCAPFAPSLALPAPLLQHATVTACAARGLLTIENATSFAEVCQQRPPELLVIFTGGFASPALTQFLRHFHQVMPHCGLWHWGDWDAGGFRILAHLRQFVPLRAFATDATWLDEHHASRQPLTDNDRKNLAALLEYPQLADCRPLITRLLAENCKLEQESLAFPALWAAASSPTVAMA